MDLWSYLLKPVQRISKYSLLLQDMVRECGPQRARERAEIQAALEVIRFQLRHGNDLLAMDDIQDCDVSGEGAGGKQEGSRVTDSVGQQLPNCVSPRNEPMYLL